MENQKDKARRKANTDRLAAIEGVFIFYGFPMRWGSVAIA